ncbi:MAG: zinc-dependent metalloprotease [Acidobacteria bacterium]|nr:zinc-dependent metalloprotease [Acidobacteriota bacterium]
MAERIAIRASGTEPFARSYHYDSLAPDFTRLTALAEELVERETGLRSLAGPARSRVTDRAGWIRANISAFRRLLSPLIEKFDGRLGSGAAAPVMARLAGAELGLVLGWMSGRVLGQYDLLVVEEQDPLDQDIVYYVGPNVLAIEKRFAFPPEQFRLWLALHEVTHRMQFTGVPWLREHFIGLVHETVGAVDPDPGRLFENFSRAATAWRSGTDPLADGGLATLFAGPEQRAVLDRISGMMSLLEGHGDVTMDRAGEGLVPSAARFGQVLRERRQSATGVAKLLQRLIGLEAKLNQYAHGEAFIAAVEREGGSTLLARAWESADNLPSLLEIREPHRWIERMRAPLVVA